jgi:hypothetical protein
MIEVLTRLIVIVITLFIIICLTMVELFDYKFSKKFKIAFWMIFVMDLVLTSIFSNYVWN